jgi:hypothetical protein
LDGGAIGEVFNADVDSSDVIKLDKCLFVSNYTSDIGGVISLRTIRFECVKCSFLHNRANDGCAVAGNLSCSNTFDKCLFFENVARLCDGAGFVIFATPKSTSTKLSLKNTTFYGNRYLETCVDANDLDISTLEDSCVFFFFFLLYYFLACLIVFIILFY